MPQYTAILRSVSAQQFSETLAASGRKAREVYFHRHSIRSPKSTGLPKAGAKNEARTAQLFSALKTTDDDELAEEVLRTYLLAKRPMLAAALDHLGIPHTQGLTDSEDVNRIEKLSADDLKALATELTKVAERRDIALYLKFMGATAVDAVFE